MPAHRTRTALIPGQASKASQWSALGLRQNATYGGCGRILPLPAAMGVK